jgi:hypothetical protein
MAKKDPSLSLSYILQKQESDKLSGLSSSVRQQLTSIEMPGATAEPSNKILLELQRINRSLNVGLNNNISKMAASLSRNNSLLSLLVKGTNRKEVQPKTKNDLSQQDIEDQDYKKKQLNLLEKIALNTLGKKDPKEKGMGWLGTIIAGLLGAIIGSLRGYLKALKLIATALMPDVILKRITTAFKSMVTFFEDLFKSTKTKLSNAFRPVGDIFTKAFTKLKGVFSFSENSPVVKIFRSISKMIGKFIAPFAEAFQLIKGMVAGPIGKISSIFSNIFKWLGKFAGMFKFIGVIAQKLAIPITIIMGIWSSVKGAIEGFEKEGLMGAVSGAIKGLINGVFMSFFDLIKDMGSWVAKKLGFDKVSELLDSFSFEDLFTKFVDAVFHPIETIKNIFGKLVAWFKTIEIPAIGFTAFGKKFGAGPWHPFASDKTGIETGTTVTAPAIEVKPAQVISPVTSANAVYERSGDNQEATMQPFAAPSTNIVSAPTNITRQTQNNLMKVNIRNQESTIKNYYRSRFST